MFQLFFKCFLDKKGCTINNNICQIYLFVTTLSKEIMSESHVKLFTSICYITIVSILCKYDVQMLNLGPCNEY